LRRENALLQREFRWAPLNEGNGPTIALHAPMTSTVRIKEISDLLADFNGDKDTFDMWKRQAQILRATD